MPTKKDTENNLIVLTFRIFMAWLPGQDIEMRRDKKKTFTLKTPIALYTELRIVRYHFPLMDLNSQWMKTFFDIYSLWDIDKPETQEIPVLPPNEVGAG